MPWSGRFIRREALILFTLAAEKPLARTLVGRIGAPSAISGLWDGFLQAFNGTFFRHFRKRF